MRDARDELDTLPTKSEVGKRELDSAVKLIEQLTVPWEPHRYHDTYRERVLELIQSKARGERVEPTAAARGAPATVDLMEALQRSVEEARGKRSERKAERRDKREDLSRLPKRELQKQARRLGVPGRSGMSRADLEDAVRKAS